MSDTSATYDWKHALQPLLSIPPGDCVALPPERLPAGEGLEWLVQWRSTDRSNRRWRLTLTERPLDDSASSDAPRSLEATIDPALHTLEVRWENADAAFIQRMQEKATGIATGIASRQEEARQELHRVSGLEKTKRHPALAYLPHLVIILGLTAFAYMFSIVHIK